MKDFNLQYRAFFIALACVAGIPAAKGDFLKEGRNAFLNYDFDLASELYDKYAKTLKKTPDEHNEQLLDKYLTQLEIAESSLDNVQKIEIIDRIDVPASDFFKYVKLPSSGSKLLNRDLEAVRKHNNQSDFVFTTESGDVMMWSENNENHKEVIMQSERLMDGSWEEAHCVGEILNEGGNARNPFMLSDGLTLYYSSDGEGSMGGYDLFVATMDPTNGEFRQPIGLGYPFNSPFNEYMMAVDEDNGIGWWVTDRNRLDGQVSVYVFKTNDVRKNYITDEEEDIISLARVADISLTQNHDTDYAAIIKSIDKRSQKANSVASGDFCFVLPGGKVARKISDFSSGAAKSSMQQYLKAESESKDMKKKLTELRKKYHNTDKKLSSASALKNQILELEKKCENQEIQLKKMRNSIISAEMK